MSVPLILWDIDGTLIVGGPASRQALVDAVCTVLGHRDVDDHHAMAGKTDSQIVREMLAAAGMGAAEVESRHALALRHAESEMAAVRHRIALEGRVLPGVELLLPRLANTAVQTALTGNIQPNALVKLAAFGLDRWLDLDIGAYGSDHHDRRELVPMALDRATARHGRRWQADEVWVVGDTPRDHACAAAAGVRCLLVATGNCSYEDLLAVGAEAVLHDLADVDSVVSLLTA